ncbi:MAG TPA: zinc-binding alcohol dehydrogenase [Hyphomicrobium sp.]|nr:zinc-binding alcohol dehydrogenase [Hyphomicrobium sp.]
MESRAAGPMRRSQGQMVVARALWYVKPGVAELRTERLAAPAPGEARVKTLFSAVSRGTERLVAFGHVPRSEWQRMRAPLQSGAFPFPVKYGYSAAGKVIAGPENLAGKNVFCLHPHQDHFQAACDMLIPIPEAVPVRRATLAANMETALNAHWDAGAAPGDRILVIGAGVVGLLVARLASRIAGVHVGLCDTDPAKAALAAALDIPFMAPADAPGGNQIIFHTSATAAGLQTAIDAAAFEGRIVELSWFGDRSVSVDLGGAFHAGRLRLISSQVGHVAASRRNTVNHRKRLEMALELLDDPALDALVTQEIAFEHAAEQLPALLTGTAAGLPPIIRYSD